MNSSDKTDLIGPALIDFHRRAEPIPKHQTAQVGPRAYHYADMATLLAAIKPALIDAGLVLSQTFRPVKSPEAVAGVQRLAYLRTQVTHAASGQWIASTVPIVAAWSDPQKAGSAITYYRRYAILALLCLAAEDDDGASGSVTDRDVRPTRIANGNGREPHSAAGDATAKISPRDASDLWKRARARDAREGGEQTVRFLHELGRERGWPHRGELWTKEQVAEAWQEAKRFFARPKNGEGAPR